MTRVFTDRPNNRPLLAVLVGCAAALACSETNPPSDPIPAGDGIVLTQVASGLEAPVYLTAIPDDPRIFVVEQAGRIRVISGGQLIPTPYLDITDKTNANGEQGLLSVVFHPDYEANAQFFVNYTDLEGRTVVERYRGTDQDNVADPTSAFRILSVDQPFGNHNGGQLQIGVDGMLYIGMGDGGSGGDPNGNGQDRNTLLGALLRLEVDNQLPYAIPSDNPFQAGGGRPEVWAYGLRNPWRFSFDRGTQDLYIADVGQNRLEEINVVPLGAAGLNYGWNTMEGTECFGGGQCDSSTLTLPAHEYGRSDGCSVTGGYVYRGTSIPGLVGHYLYGDFCSGWVRSFRYVNGEATEHAEWFQNVGAITSFGEDAQGEIYVLTTEGTIHRIDPG